MTLLCTLDCNTRPLEALKRILFMSTPLTHGHTGRWHWHTLCVNEQCMFVAFLDTYGLHKMSLDGKMIETYGKGGNKEGKFAGLYACMSDCDDNLLITDLGNNRLQLLHWKQWSTLQLQPPPLGPLNVVYNGHALYVVQWDTMALVKYEAIEWSPRLP